jgi:anhydro-N-acetylmuramic acid kinase
MSGSSLDGLDVVAVTFGEHHDFNIQCFETYKFDSALIDKLKKISDNSTLEYFHTSAMYSKFVAKQILKFVKKNKLQPSLVCIHGHTVYHNPTSNISKQMIEGGIVSSLTGIDCLVDFRIQDITSGGQGAPLAPIVEDLLGDHKFYLNLGGIANISIHIKDKCIAYDIGPCNQLFNAIANKVGMPYDKNGNLGQKGQVNQSLLKEWLCNDFIELKPPKSIDNTWLKQNFIDNLPNLNPEDLIATAYEFVAIVIRDEISKYANQNDSVFVTGGGTHNTYFIKKIIAMLNLAKVETVIPSPLIIDAKEALLMAYMGYLYSINESNTIPSVTGSIHSHVAGALYKGSKKCHFE